MTAIVNFFIRLRNLVVHEIPLLLAAAITATSVVTDQSAKAYGIAAAVAALRFVVSPAFEQAALKAKVVDPQLIEAVSRALAARETVKAALITPPLEPENRA